MRALAVGRGPLALGLVVLLLIAVVVAAVGVSIATRPPAAAPESFSGQPVHSLAGPHNADNLPAHQAPGFFGAEAESSFTGAKSWVVLRCKYQSTFSGQTAKQSSKTFLQTLYGNSRPNLGHYWNTVSYGKISINATIPGSENEWRTLPNPNSSYATYNDTLFDRLASDCAQVWNADVNFASYGYVAFLVDQKVQGAAGVGGSFNIDKDGVAWQAGTLLGSSHHDTALNVHEMGHAFNLPHSASPDGGLYNTAYDVLSAPGGLCNAWRADYGCDAGELTTFHKWWLLGWIRDNRVFVPTNGGARTVTIERQSDPASTSNPLAARIWVNAQTSYIVESRMNNGANTYDKQTPGNAVVISKATTSSYYGQRWGAIEFVGTDAGNDGWWADAGTMWTPGETWTSPEGISVKVNGQGTSAFSVTINTPIAPGNLEGAGQQDATPPTISINNVSVNEGNGSGTTDMNFTVSLSKAHDTNVSLLYATGFAPAGGGFGSAEPWVDFQGANNEQVFFYAGETSKTLTVKVMRDGIDEPDERFEVQLYSPINATIADDTGIGTIKDDDAAAATPTSPPAGGQPTLSITDVSKLEQDPTATVKTVNFAFTIRLSAASSSKVTVVVSTANGAATATLGGATAPSDYVARNGVVVTFQPGQTSKNFVVRVKRDNAAEPDERFFVNLSSATGASISDGQGVGRIRNDD